MNEKTMQLEFKASDGKKTNMSLREIRIAQFIQGNQKRTTYQGFII